MPGHLSGEKKSTSKAEIFFPSFYNQGSTYHMLLYIFVFVFVHVCTLHTIDTCIGGQKEAGGGKGMIKHTYDFFFFLLEYVGISLRSALCLLMMMLICLSFGLGFVYYSQIKKSLERGGKKIKIKNENENEKRFKKLFY